MNIRLRNKADWKPGLDPSMTTKPKRKPRGVVARFLAGESLYYDIAWDWSSRRSWPVPFAATHVEALLRRALKKKVGKR